MYTGPTIFSQLMQHLPWHHFRRCVYRYRGNHKVKKFKCTDHFRVMSFAQLTYRESLRDIEACLRAMRPKLYHMGIHTTVSRNNLSNANEKRDWRIYAEFAQFLIAEARRLYADEELAVDLDASVYALDSTTIDLCLSMFPWARFRRRKGAVKMHTLLNLRGSIPEFILISDGKMHDVNVLDYLVPMPGAYYLMDRGYLDFERLYEINTCQAFFVTRAKDNFKFKRRYSRPVDRTTGLICDQTVILTTFYPAKAYPEPLRRIKFRDPEDPNSLLVFLVIALSVGMVSNVQYPRMPRIGFRTVRGLLGLGFHLTVISFAIWSRDIFFFPLGITYGSYGILRAAALGFVERSESDSGENGQRRHIPFVIRNKKKRTSNTQQ